MEHLPVVPSTMFSSKTRWFPKDLSARIQGQNRMKSLFMDSPSTQVKSSTGPWPIGQELEASSRSGEHSNESKQGGKTEPD